MTIKLGFFGAARSVTGSRYLVEANGTRLLVDCGMYQERQFRSRDWSPFPVDPKTIEAVLLTHAHLDHCGLLPKLVKDGFHRSVHCTPATREIAEIILMDSARLMTEDAEFKKRRHKREGRTGPFEEAPLYTTGDVEVCLPRFVPANYKQRVEIGNGIEAVFFDAGHTLGSAMLQICINQGGKETTILFSGDMGRPGKPILMDPTVFKAADYVVVESTYGDRLLDPPQDMAGKMAEHINWTVSAGGNVVIPSFALERTQEVMYYLNELLLKDEIPHLMVFLDSPMAASITEVFRHHHELMDDETINLIRQGNSPFDFPGFNVVKTPDQSKALNRIRGTVVIIAGSGMCTGGRIKHHLTTNISRSDSTILFVGYQAGGTLGREIVDGATAVRILGQQYPVKARVVYLHGFSGHADQQQLLGWLLSLSKPPKGVFVTHGESGAAEGFADLVSARTGWQVTAPQYGDEVILG